MKRGWPPFVYWLLSPRVYNTSMSIKSSCECPDFAQGLDGAGADCPQEGEIYWLEVDGVEREVVLIEACVEFVIPGQPVQYKRQVKLRSSGLFGRSIYIDPNLPLRPTRSESHQG